MSRAITMHSRSSVDSSFSSTLSGGTLLTSVGSLDALLMRVFLVQTARGLFSSSGGYKANICLLRYLASRGHTVRQLCYAHQNEVDKYVQKLAETGGNEPHLRKRTLLLKATGNSPSTDIQITELIMDDGVGIVVLEEEAFDAAFGGKEAFHKAMSKEIAEYIEVTHHRTLQSQHSI
jgi:hypothetical protein